MDDDNFIRRMLRMHKTGGFFKYVPTPNDNVDINVGGLGSLFEATGWHLDMNEDRRWEVHCFNPSPCDYIVYRSKPFTDKYEVLTSFRVPAHSDDLIIETLQPDNEDQWWPRLKV